MAGSLKILAFCASVTLLFASCTKSYDTLVDGNRPPNYGSIPTLKIDNYVNRLFIDFLGREATEVERNDWVFKLKSNGLAYSTRDSLIRILQWDSTFRLGDSSYRHAYSQRLYDVSKARFLEGASDPDIGQAIGSLRFGITVARLEGDSVRVYANLDAISKYSNVLISRHRYRLQEIGYSEMVACMINNPIYDGINMNSFNYVIASFDDVLRRNPTQDEFTRAYQIIDKNEPQEIFGVWAANKNEYAQALTQTDGFFEAQIRWSYFLLVQREPLTKELNQFLQPYLQNRRIEDVQRAIAITDEYAQF
jgi:hypothetical protein